MAKKGNKILNVSKIKVGQKVYVNANMKFDDGIMGVFEVVSSGPGWLKLKNSKGKEVILSLRTGCISHWTGYHMKTTIWRWS